MTTIQSVYVDENGRARLSSSIVGFIDLFEFSQLVTSTDRNGDSNALLDMIVDTIRDSQTLVRDEVAANFAERKADLTVQLLSNNLVVGCPFDQTAVSFASTAWCIIRFLQHFQLQMILKGLFLRGRVSHGPACLSDEVIFGPGLMQRDQLESDESFVPRVVLSSSFSNALIRSCREDGKQSLPVCYKLISLDVDSNWFVNYLQATSKADRVDWKTVERHKESILSSLSITARQNVLSNYERVCHYHNIYCYGNRNDTGYQERYLVNEVDVRSTIYRLDEIPVSDLSST